MLAKNPWKTEITPPPAVRQPTRKPEPAPDTLRPGASPKTQISSYNFKDELLMHSSFELSVIYLNLYEEVSPGIHICLFEKKDILFI